MGQGSAFFLFVIVLLYISVVHAQDFFVNGKFNNTESCTRENPCGTVSEGISAACSYYSETNSSATIWVSAGSYNEENITVITITCPLSLISLNGSQNTFIMYGIQAESIEKGYIRVEGFTIVAPEEKSIYFDTIDELSLKDISFTGGNSPALVGYRASNFSASSLMFNNITTFLAIRFNYILDVKMDNVTVTNGTYNQFGIIHLSSNIVLTNWQILGLHDILYFMEIDSNATIRITGMEAQENSGDSLHGLSGDFLCLTAPIITVSDSLFAKSVFFNSMVTAYGNTTISNSNFEFISRTKNIISFIPPYEGPEIPATTVISNCNLSYLSATKFILVLQNSGSAIIEDTIINTVNGIRILSIETVENYSLLLSGLQVNTSFVDSFCDSTFITGDMVIQNCIFENPIRIFSGPTVQEETGYFSAQFSSFDSSFTCTNNTFNDFSVKTMHISAGSITLTDTKILNFFAPDVMVMELFSPNLLLERFMMCNGLAKTLWQTSYSNIRIVDSLFQLNHATSEGIFFSYCKVNISDTMFSGNTMQAETGSVLMFLESSLSALRLTANENNSTHGGVILASESSSITITDSTFTKNSAKAGGSIFTTDTCTVVVYNTTVTEGSALADGAAFCFTGTTNGNITNSRFTDNIAGNTGGGIVLIGTNDLVLDGVVFDNNQALLGGGLYMSDHSSPTIVRSVFSNCVAQTGGGGIFITSYSEPTITNCTISKCIANSAGSGINVQAFAKPIFSYVVIEDNFTPNEAAGMYLEDKSNSTLDFVVFARNRAGSSSGALLLTVNSTAVISNSEFIQNESGSKGGAIGVSNRATPHFYSCLIQNNVANTGGSMFASDSSNPYFFNCSFLNNSAISRAGCIYISTKAYCIFTNSIISGNKAPSGAGGGFLIEDNASVLLAGTTISFNEATHGGGIYTVASVEPSVSAYNCIIENNKAKITGGGISMGEISDIRLNSCTCRYNSVVNGDGGCLYASDVGVAYVVGSTFTGNEARYGGAIACADTSFVNSTDSIYSENIASNGGAIYVYPTGIFAITDSLVNDNNATGQGGGLFLSGKNIIVYNCTITRNNAPLGGGVAVAYGNNSAAILILCLFTENTGSTAGGGMYILTLQNDIVNVDYSSFWYDEEKMQRKEESLVKVSQTISWAREQEAQVALGEISTLNFLAVEMVSNSALSAGAIYYDSSYPTNPSFDRVLLTNNSAKEFGGAFAIGFFSYNETLLCNAIFTNNSAIYGGGNAGFGFATVDPNDFCLNCTYGPTTGGYNNEDGMATIPSKIGFADGEDSCPSSLTMSAPASVIEVFLYDEFNTIVDGEFLDEYTFTVELSYKTLSGEKEVSVSASSFSQRISNTTGSAQFENIQFCAANNSTVSLDFFVKGPPEFPQIGTLGCNILLYGCNEGFEVSDDGDGCDICVESKIGIVWFIILVLFISCCTLAGILIVILSSFAGWRYWKQRKKAKRQAMEIPDFTGRPSLTLDDILNDPAISRIPWEEIEIGGTIGKGASGLVSKGTWKPSGKGTNDIALKELIFGFQDFGLEVLDEFLVEIKYMSALVHENIVQFLGICVPPDNSKLYLVTELMHYGSLRDVMDKKGKNIPMDMRVQFAKDAAKGMAYLHSKKLIHRDLKTDNLLVNNEWHCKVADFGISTVKPTITRAMTCIGTPVYMAPEVLSKNKYSEKADVYSFGILLYEIFSGNRPYGTGKFAEMNQAQLMFQIIEKEARPPLDDLDIGLQQLIRDCWDLDPRLRPSFSESVVRLRRLKLGNKTKKYSSVESSNTPQGENDDKDIMLPPVHRNSIDVTSSSEFNFDLEARNRTNTTTRLNFTEFTEKLSENDSLIN